jgi:hypothetical protein
VVVSTVVCVVCPYGWQLCCVSIWLAIVLCFHMAGNCVVFPYGWQLCCVSIWLAIVLCVHMAGNCVVYPYGWQLYCVSIWLAIVLCVHMAGNRKCPTTFTGNLSFRTEIGSIDLGADAR